MEKIAITQARKIDKAVRRSINLIGGLNLKGDEHVIIKPNICNGKNPHGMVITDFKLIKSVIDVVVEAGCEVTIVESDNISGSADDRLKQSGLMKELEEWNTPFLNLSKDEYQEHEIAGVLLRLPSTVLDADYFINLPKIKTCAHTLVTLSIKNLYGVFQRSKKNSLHEHLDEILPYLAQTIKHDLIIVDGLVCMEGNGPVIGTPRNMGIILAGRNPVSIDAICSHLMGFDPREIPHLKLSADLGLGEIDINKINLLGDDWNSFSCQFDKPYTISSTLKSIGSIKDRYFSF
jgi:uncharacterized protein (DUF362 family)